MIQIRDKVERNPVIKGFKRIFRDREIREAFCLWFGFSVIAGFGSCFILSFWKRAESSSWAAALGNLWDTIKSLGWLPCLHYTLCTGLAMLGWFAYIEFRNKGTYRRYLSCLCERFNWQHFMGGLLISVLVTLAAVIIAWGVDYVDDSGRGVMHYLADNPGGVFAILTGFATIVGTYVAIQSILELKHTITSFPQLIDRVINLIQEVGDSKDGVMILAYSPMSGAWNIEESQKDRLKDEINCDHHKVRMICLNAEDHLQLLVDVARKGTQELGKITPEIVAELHNDCGGLINKLSKKGVKELGCSNPKPGTRDYATVVGQLPRSLMPGYYFYLSESRAIVVSPIGLPADVSSANVILSGKGQVIDIGKLLASDPRQINVETLGFETTDRHIIKMLKTEFARHEAIAEQHPPADWPSSTAAAVRKLLEPSQK